MVDPDALPETSVPLVTIDIETPMPPNDWVIEQVGWSETNLKTTAKTAKWGGYVAENIRFLMDDKRNTIAFHNAAFDLPRLER